MQKKLRVYELARELNLDNSEVIFELQHMGVPVTSHSNTVEDRLADQLRRRLKTEAAEVAAPVEEEVVVKESVNEVVETPPAPPPLPPPVQEEPKEAQPIPVPTAKVETKPVEPEVEQKAPSK